MPQTAIYLDHNASSPLLPEARSALLAGLELVGNPSSVHGHGRALHELIERGRDAVAQLAGAERQQVVFTGSATEAIHQAIVGGVRALRLDGVVVSAGEHPAVLKAAELSGAPVTTLPLDAAGRVSLGALSEQLAAADTTGTTLLVAIQAVNNETGVCQDLVALAALVGPTRHYLFIDAVQAFGKLPMEFASNAADMMAISGHKIGAPVGVGALLMKAPCVEVRLLQGGGHEQGRRAGTQSAALIAAFGAAAAAFPAHYAAERQRGLLAQLEASLHEMAPDIVIFGAGATRVGNVVNFAVPGLRASVAMMGLDLLGLSVSSGSACSSGKVGPSHVLEAMGVSPELAECALRVSLGWSSTGTDVTAFLSGFGVVLGRQRRQVKAA